MTDPENVTSRMEASEELRDLTLEYLPAKALSAQDTVTAVYWPRIGVGRCRLQLDYEPLANLVNGKVAQVISSDCPSKEIGSPWIHFAHCIDFTVDVEGAGVYYHEHAEVLDDGLEKVVNEESDPMTAERIEELRGALAKYAAGELEVTAFEAGRFESRAGAELNQTKLNGLFDIFKAI